MKQKTHIFTDENERTKSPRSAHLTIIVLHDPAPSVRPYVVVPTGRQPQRSNPVNPTYRTNQRQPQLVVPSASAQSFPPLNQPVPTGRVETSGTGGVPAFPAGNLDWLKNFLQEILSPEDYLKYKSSF